MGTRRDIGGFFFGFFILVNANGENDKEEGVRGIVVNFKRMVYLNTEAG